MLTIVLVVAALLLCYFTKPGKEDFIKYIQPTVTKYHIPPVIEYQDKILYTKVVATFIDAGNTVSVNNRAAAPARREAYIGFFKKFWKLGQ